MRFSKVVYYTLTFKHVIFAKQKCGKCGEITITLFPRKICIQSQE